MNTSKQAKTLPPSMVIPNFIKISAKIASYLPSFLTLRLADKLFTTPVKFTIPEREQTMQKSAQKKRVLIKSINKEIDVLSYGYSPKKVLLVHGWSGRSTQLFMVADKLLENRYMTISFDATAHGNSEGKTSFMPEFVEIIKQLNEEMGPFESAVGHSLGGMALYNAEKDLQLKSLVTIGSGDTITEIINRFVENVNFKASVAKKLKRYYDQMFNRDIDENSSSVQAKDITIPTLVVHDSQDGDVAVSCAYNIRQNLHNGSLLITKGLGHTKILRDKNTMNKIVDFIKKHQ